MDAAGKLRPAIRRNERRPANREAVCGDWNGRAQLAAAELGFVVGNNPHFRRAFEDDACAAREVNLNGARLEPQPACSQRPAALWDRCPFRHSACDERLSIASPAVSSAPRRWGKKC
jgi:hypothetical protein